MDIKLPDKYIDRMCRKLGNELPDYLKSLKAQPIKGLHINLCKCAYNEIDSKISGLSGLDADENLRIVVSGRPARHPFHAAGLFYMQEPSAMLPVSALELERGMKVLDMCAAPGGKSSQLAIKLGGSGLLVANEVERPRAEILRENIVRMGYQNVLITNLHPDRLAHTFGGYFDVVVVDAPCSGEGMLRKEPQAATDWSEANVRACAVRQTEIIKSADKCLKEGGILLYSTCTFSDEEDEGIARFILSLGYEIKQPRLAVTAGAVSEGLGYRFYPHRTKGEGQYFCLFRKVSEGERTAKLGKSYADAPRRAASEINKVINTDGLRIAEKNGMLFVPAYGNEMPCLADGVMLGRLEKDGRFTPAHGLFTAMGERCKAHIDFSADDSMLMDYLLGKEIEGDVDGWCAVRADGHTIGGGKGSGGKIKNHYPKNLRRRGD